MQTWVKRLLASAILVAVFILGANTKKITASMKRKVSPKKETRVFPVVEHKSFVVIIPSYNNEAWYKKNLASILEQKYDNFRVIYANDASTDSTKEKAEQFLAEHAQGIPYELWDNPSNLGPAGNIYQAVMSCDDQDIVVLVDGDDWLAHDHVLEKLNEVYADPDVWMTCGNHLEYVPYTYIKAQCTGELPQEVIDNKTLRAYVPKKFPLSHLKTFYAGLFKRVELQDFQTHDGKFFECAGDMAMMIPMAEMAGTTHYRHIPDILYIYNHVSPINEDKVRGERQYTCMVDICSRTPYELLDRLFDEKMCPDPNL